MLNFGNLFWVNLLFRIQLNDILDTGTGSKSRSSWKRKHTATDRTFSLIRISKYSRVQWIPREERIVVTLSKNITRISNVPNRSYFSLFLVGFRIENLWLLYQVTIQTSLSSSSLNKVRMSFTKQIFSVVIIKKKQY